MRHPRHHLLFLLIALLLAPTVAGAQTRLPGVGMVVSTPELAVRACPRLDCDVITTVTLGQTVKVIGDPENGFLPVRHNSDEGWAYALFIASDTQGVPVLDGGAPGCNRVALIFNVGIGEPIAWSVLDVLAATGAPATFFVQEWWTGYYPAWVEGLRADGYVVGGHGGKVQADPDASALELSSDVADTIAAIADASDAPADPVFTPYALDTDPRGLAAIAFGGALPVLWTLSAHDDDADATVAKVTDRVVNSVADGSIVLFTLDGENSPTVTADALARIIPALEDAGLTLVTVPEIALPCG